MIIANDLALEHLIDSCQMILQGIPGSHQHFLQEVNGTTGNVKRTDRDEAVGGHLDQSKIIAL